MKVGIFYSDGLIGNITLNKVVPQMIEAGIEPVLFRSRGPNIKRASIPELKALSFLETDLLKLVVEPTLSSFSYAENIFFTTPQLIINYNLEHHDVLDVNAPEFIRYINYSKDLTGAISIRFYPKFKFEIINALNKKGFLWNLHTGLLPKYKGVFIPYRAIENREKYFGWTLHEVASEIDTGDIIATDKLPLIKNQPVLNTYLDMTEKGSAMVMGALLFYKSRKTIPAKKQDVDIDSYFTYPTSNEMKQWNNQGIRFADDIVETYCDLFAVRGSKEENILRLRLSEFIESTDIAIQSLAA